MLKQYISDLKEEFAGYNSKFLSKDIMSGLTVAAVALPLALAFGVSSGATASAGLITAVLGGIIISLFSGASYQISGPTGAMSAILISLSLKSGLNGIFIASFLAGILLIIAGFLHFGKIVSFIPSSVITGFTSGIACLIAFGQLDNFFGTIDRGGELAISKLLSYFTNGFHPQLESTIIGILVVILMFAWPPKFGKFIPASLLSIILATALTMLFNLNTTTVGAIPQTLLLKERLTFSTLASSNISSFLSPAISIAALAMIESLLCGASAGKLKNEKLNADRELVAQGIGNMVIPLFGGIPATAAIARTSVAIKSGAVTRLTGIFHAIGILLSMFILAPFMSKIPLSALAGVLIVTAVKMNDFENIKFIFQNRFKSGIAKYLVTLTATVFLDLTQAIVIGICISCFLVLINLANLDVQVEPIQKSKLSGTRIELTNPSRKVKVMYLTGAVFFAGLTRLEEEMHSLERTSVLIISMRGVPLMDLSGVQKLFELIHEMQEETGTIVMLSSVQPKVLELLERGGIVKLLNGNIFPSAEYAIEKAHSLL